MTTNLCATDTNKHQNKPHKSKNKIEQFPRYLLAIQEHLSLIPTSSKNKIEQFLRYLLAIQEHLSLISTSSTPKTKWSNSLAICSIIKSTPETVETVDIPFEQNPTGSHTDPALRS